MDSYASVSLAMIVLFIAVPVPSTSIYVACEARQLPGPIGLAPMPFAFILQIIRASRGAAIFTLRKRKMNTPSRFQISLCLCKAASLGN